MLTRIPLLKTADAFRTAPALATFAAALVFVLTPHAIAKETIRPGAAGPDQLAFSTTNMDTAISPAADFYHYAAGNWLKRVKPPERFASYGFFETMADGVQHQMTEVLVRADDAAATAEAGSPAQQVGTFYNAYIDVAARDAAGLAPIRHLLDDIAAVQDFDQLAGLMANLSLNGGPALFVAIGPDIDLADNSRYVTYAGAGQLGLAGAFEDVFDEADGGARITAYRAYLADVLKIAGRSEDEAARVADLSIRVDRRLHAAKLTPAESVDLRAIYNPVTLDALQAQVLQLDLRRLIEAQGFPLPDLIILTEPRYFTALSSLLGELSMQDIRDYAEVQTLLAFQPYLSTVFDAPVSKLNHALLGVGVLPPIEERALGLIKVHLGHPVSQLYVQNFFPEDTRGKAIEMIGLIKAAFEERMPSRDWLSPETRAAALTKLNSLSFKVGYPEEWIDYSGVPVTRDLVATIAEISRFNIARLRDKQGKPVSRDWFSSQDALPIVVNAGYNPSVNGFEVPAAIIQPPIFDADMDAPVNFCRMGAVIGHEMTHGFDRTGKSFDGDGNMRNWWLPEDEAAFDERAQGLVTQANGYEVLPGVFGNGPLEVGENMADLGGITLAHAALRTYLAAHPEEDMVIDGLTPDQRCFIAWAQLWAWQGKDEVLRSAVATDHHPPNAYRAVAPLLHLDAFYYAFGIKEGDPMWLAPALRVQAW